MKKSLSLLIFLCGLCLLAGCGAGNPPPPPPSLMTTQAQLTAAPAVAGTPYSFTFQAAGTGTLTWSAVGLPSNNLSLNPATGIVSGTPASKASVVFTLTATDTSGHSSPATQFTITVNNPPPPSIATTQAQLAATPLEVGNSYNFSFTATGGLAPLTWTESGALPSTFGLSPAGVLSGTATATGTFPITVMVQDAASQESAPQNFALTVINPPPPAINTSPAPSVAVVNQPYTFTFTATGGLAPLTWTQSGALPAGLTFSQGGVLSGTPTMTGSFPISVMVHDLLGQNAPPQDFTIDAALGFSLTGSMETSRVFQTATLLNDGRVLVAGGYSGTGALASAELYDPASGTFSSTTGSMSTAREEHTATLLPDGKVLIVGGTDANGVLVTAELFNPATSSFSSTGSMTTPRERHTATLLNNGQVLVAGGFDPSMNILNTLASAELYDPSTQTFTALSVSMETPRAEHTATLLNDGKVLLAGGGSGLATAELFDPSTKTFTPTTKNMTTARTRHTATLLKDGRVLIAGGADQAAELFDPKSGTFAATGGMTNEPQALATATSRNDGTVLLAGGYFDVTSRNCPTLQESTATAVLFDPASGSFTPTGNLSTGRAEHTATLLKNGHILVTGGITSTVGPPPIRNGCGTQHYFGQASAELFP
jgi:WD40 repeat protein